MVPLPQFSGSNTGALAQGGAPTIRNLFRLNSFRLVSIGTLTALEVVTVASTGT